jgi:HEAT repeat protein
MLRPLLWTSFAVLVSLTGCQGDPQSPVYWDKQLNGTRQAKDKVRLLSHLRDSHHLNPSFLPVLHTHLASERSPEVKGSIAHLLAELRDRSSVQPLIEAADLGNTDSAGNAMNKEIAAALGRIGDPQALPALMRMMNSRDQYVRIEAINALGASKAKEAVEPLMSIANDEEGEPYVAKRAIQALGEIGDPRAVPTLVRLMFKQRRGVTFYPESSFALFQIGRPAADALLAVLAGKDQGMVAWARQNRVIEPALYAKSAEVLGDLLEARAENLLLSRLKFSSDYLDLKLFVRLKSAEALGRLRCSGAAKPVAAMLAAEKEAPAQAEYVRALARIASREALPPLLGAAAKGDWEGREQALIAITMLGDERELPSLEKLAKLEGSLSQAECKSNRKPDGCQNPSELAKRHVAAIQSHARRLEVAKACHADPACWAKQLEQKDPLLRERAAYELGRSRKAEMASPLVKHLTEANLRVRLAVIQALTWLVSDSQEGARAAAGLLERIEQQLSAEKGSTDFAQVNEDLRRLAARLRRQPV